MKAYTDKGWSRDFAKLVEDMCCQSLQYKKEIRIEGVLAVTLDHSEVVVSNDTFLTDKITCSKNKPTAAVVISGRVLSKNGSVTLKQSSKPIG